MALSSQQRRSSSGMRRQSGGFEEHIEEGIIICDIFPNLFLLGRGAVFLELKIRLFTSCYVL
ncbi:MAG: hypothetical protein QW282_01320 [Nitrososphaerales archaeon]